jgi:hypothetical protein
MDIIHLSKVSRTTGPEVWHDYNQYRREKLHQNPWDYYSVVIPPGASLKNRETTHLDGSDAGWRMVITPTGRRHDGATAMVIPHIRKTSDQ